MWNNNLKTAVAKAVFERIGEYKCPMCGNSEFSIVEEFGIHLMRPIENPEKISRGVPYVMLICGKCGFMSQHNAISIGIFDFLDKEEISIINDKSN